MDASVGTLVLIGLLVSVLMSVGGLAAVGVLLVRLPSNYFCHSRPRNFWIDRHPVTNEDFTRFVKVTFFQGTSLRPVPPGGTGKDARWIDVHEDDLDEAQMAEWIRQAADLPGWGKV